MSENRRFSVFIIVYLIQVSFACKCATPTQKDVWNRSDVVAKMRIVSMEKDGNQIKYKADYLDTFKPANRVHIEIPFLIITSASSASCGVEALKPGNEYLITATESESGDLRINTCNGMPSGRKGYGPLGTLHWKYVDSNLLKKLRSGQF